MITGDCYRITWITPKLIRLEYHPEGHFTDCATQLVVNRQMPEASYMLKREDGCIVTESEDLILRYDEQPFSSQGLSVSLKKTGVTWHYSREYGNCGENLKGTARTLDMANGTIPLDTGIFGKKGYAILDDSHSPVYENGEFSIRKNRGLDLYFFGYGTDYAAGLRDFQLLCGATPMIPRYALGNWWSRYYRYTQEGYLEVMDRFKEENIPLSVSVIDMDWHLTEVDPKYGTGWTGYTWDTQLFPDYRQFLKDLHARGLHTTLNLHPADGIRGFEVMYEQAARHLHMDPAEEKQIRHDLANPDYREVYFEDVLHPYEREGVDFWWIDWQQGTGDEEMQVDPLILLNHYHYKDMENRGVRPMIFSRYAGPGSHRYPIGFSGDTHATWESLDFQPYFTSTASNIGYGWWSHDIGGHMLGDKNNERLIRWIQYGVFSPIMRLHSSSSPFFNKEPWNLEEPYRSVMGSFLRLRHQLIPYIYTMLEKASREGMPLIRPMYYLCPEDARSYEVKNEYGFGDSLLVGAITRPADEHLKMASVSMLLPEGRYVDLFTGTVYTGGRKVRLYRPMESIPVLLKEGSILPLAAEQRENAAENPEAMILHVVPGKDGEFTLYEDDGISMDYTQGIACRTKYEMQMEKDGTLRLAIHPAEGHTEVIPAARSYQVVLHGVEAGEGFAVERIVGDRLEGETVECREKGSGAWETAGAAGTTDLTCRLDRSKNEIMITLPSGTVTTRQTLQITGLTPAGNHKEEKGFAVLERAWIETTVKEEIYRHVKEDGEGFLSWLSQADVDETLKDALREFYLDA
ncbi:MAG: glycoside hydrolase family 31 protein [Lachnospiraceae bacterium]|nr:glycoside hydrolase family 31 protein [Lachnospiraceae bacterium]